MDESTEGTDPFAEAEARLRQLFERLADSPVSEVLGVVDPAGAACSRLGGEELGTLTFTFDVWRMDGADLQTRPLTVRRKVTDEEFTWLETQVRPYGVLRVRARVVADSPLGTPQAALEVVVGDDPSDADLNAHAEHLRKPVTLEDPTFGTLTLDRRVSWYGGQVVWEGQPVSLNLSAKGPGEARDALKTAHALWEGMDAWILRVREFAARELLPVKNDSWLDEDEGELTADEFKDRMRLDSITVYPDGSFDMLHDDGDLFWGHAIQVRGSLSEGPTHADIPG